jgi:hypothetical protein
MKQKKIIRLFVAWLLITLSQPVWAQTPDLTQMVPFRKGDKWGLVAYSGKTFYAPLLDRVITNEYNGTLYFLDDDTGEPYFIVVKSGRQYRLTAGKKLTLSRKAVSDDEVPPLIEEAKMTEASSETNAGIAEQGAEKLPDSVLRQVRKFQPDSRDTAAVRVYRQNGVLKFFYKDQWIPQFECNAICKQELQPYEEWNMVVVKDGKKGVLDFKQLKVVIPMAYDDLLYIGSGGYFIAVSNDQAGLLNLKNGAVMIPVSDKEVSFVTKTADGIHYFYSRRQNDHYRLVSVNEENEVTTIQDGLSRQPALFSTIDSNGYTLNYFILAGNGKDGIMFLEKNAPVVFKYDKLRVGIPGVLNDDAARFVITTNNGKKGWIDMGAGVEVQPRYKLKGPVFVLNCIARNKPVCVFLVERNGKIFFCDNQGREFYKP